MHLRRALVLCFAAFAAPFALAGCPGRAPAAYPVVRYEAEPFPPPDPRDVVVDAGPSDPKR